MKIRSLLMLVAGSNPALSTIFGEMAQLVEAASSTTQNHRSFCPHKIVAKSERSNLL